MEEAFDEGQEMVVFVTELTMDPEASQFITENGCERYFKYNKTLLVGNRRAAEKRKEYTFDLENCYFRRNLFCGM